MKLEGGLYRGGGGGGEGGLKSDVFFWFTGRWAYSQGEGGGAYKRQFTVYLEFDI